jgi:lipopolysaccharide biosynthesis glycosyltransferase
MKSEKNEIHDFKIKETPILAKKKNKFNLIIYCLIILSSVIAIQFIRNNLKSNEAPRISLRKTESSSPNFTVDKEISYEENGQKLYSKFGYINMNELDKEYYGKSKVEKSAASNHIHISLCFNEEYHLLASVTIASILKNADSNSFIHLHIIALNDLKFEIMKKVYSLKEKINNNTEFIFYNGKKAEEDFELGAKDSERGIIDYARLLIPELLTNIPKVISLDIGDILVEKDLYELYNTDLQYFAYSAIVDAYPRCFLESIFNHKFKYVNGGVVLLNVQKWREIELYKYVVKMYKYVLTKTKFYKPYADIINDFLPLLSTGYLPLKFNMPEYVNLNNTKSGIQMVERNCSYYKDKRNEVIEAEKNVVIRNLFDNKVYKGEGNDIIKNDWKKYAQLTGFYEEIKKKYNLQ